MCMPRVNILRAGMVTHVKQNIWCLGLLYVLPLVKQMSVVSEPIVRAPTGQTNECCIWSYCMCSYWSNKWVLYLNLLYVLPLVKQMSVVSEAIVCAPTGQTNECCIWSYCMCSHWSNKWVCVIAMCLCGVKQSREQITFLVYAQTLFVCLCTTVILVYMHNCHSCLHTHLLSCACAFHHRAKNVHRKCPVKDISFTGQVTDQRELIKCLSLFAGRQRSWMPGFVCRVTKQNKHGHSHTQLALFPASVRADGDCTCSTCCVDSWPRTCIRILAGDLRNFPPQCGPTEITEEHPALLEIMGGLNCDCCLTWDSRMLDPCCTCIAGIPVIALRDPGNCTPGSR